MHTVSSFVPGVAANSAAGPGSICVLDTSVLLHDPEAMFAFGACEVVIPGTVIEELDEKKHRSDELGQKARAATRTLDALRSRGCLSAGVPLDGGGILRVELNHRALEALQGHFSGAVPENRILAVALNLGREAAAGGRQVVLVSGDTTLRIKADALGLPVQAFPSDGRGAQAPDQGYIEIEVAAAVVDTFFAAAGVSLPDVPLYANQFVVLRAPLSGQSAVGRVSPQGRIEPLRLGDQQPWGVRPRNVQQRMAVDLLLDDRISLVFLTGRAGTGKTLLALAAGLLKVEEEGRYRRLLVSRPIMPLGRDIGYLPGERDDKLRPWMQPIYDNLEHLLCQGGKGSEKDLERALSGVRSIAVEAITYIRGRSLPEQYLLVDEAQNLTRHEVKTIISRAGEQTKVVLVGDLEQIDHPYLDAGTCGLAHAIRCFGGQPVAGHVRLCKGERSPLARLAAELL